MHPNITLGSISFSLYAIMNILAVVVIFIGAILRKRNWEYSYTIHDITNGILQSLLGALAGGWLIKRGPVWINYLRGMNPRPSLLGGGLNWLGAVIGGSVVGYLYCRRWDLPAGKTFDLSAPILPLSHAVGRVGCLMAGCCYGKETTAWPAMVLPDSRGVWASRYPTRIASISANVLIFIILLVLEQYVARKKGKGWPFDGFLFLVYVDLYCLQRFFFEFWRANVQVLFGPFSWTHLYCAIGVVAATTAMVRGLSAARRAR